MMDALSAMDQGKLGLEKQLTELKRDLRSCSKQMARLKVGPRFHAVTSKLILKLKS